MIRIEEYFNISLNENLSLEKIVEKYSLEEKIEYLEKEIALLKETYYELNKYFEKYLVKRKLEEIPKELMSEEEKNVHLIKMCNKLGNIKAPQVECTIRIRNYLIKTNALLDTRCTHVIIDEKIILTDFIITTEKPMVAQPVDGSFNHYKYQLEPRAKLSFMTNCYSSPQYSLHYNEFWVKPLNLRHHVILGLSFLLKDNGQVTFSKYCFSLSRHSITNPL